MGGGSEGETIMQLRSLGLIVVIASFGILPQYALAWGASGHRWISELAIKALPAELPAFIRNARAAWLYNG